MPFPNWLMNLEVVKLLIKHTVTDAIAITLFWGLFHYVKILEGDGAYGFLMGRVEHITLMTLVIVFAIHVVYNVIREMFKHGQ
jgi:hypothetical protein